MDFLKATNDMLTHEKSTEQKRLTAARAFYRIRMIIREILRTHVLILTFLPGLLESKATAFPNDLDELVDRVIQLSLIRVMILRFFLC